jgi:hypothetical protein
LDQTRLAPAGSFCWNPDCEDDAQVGHQTLRKFGRDLPEECNLRSNIHDTPSRRTQIRSRSARGVQRYQCKTFKKTPAETKDPLWSPSSGCSPSQGLLTFSPKLPSTNPQPATTSTLPPTLSTPKQYRAFYSPFRRNYRAPIPNPQPHQPSLPFCQPQTIWSIFLAFSLNYRAPFPTLRTGNLVAYPKHTFMAYR